VLDPKIVAVSFVSGVVTDTSGGPVYKLYLDNESDLNGRPVINVQEEIIGILDSSNTLITTDSIAEFMKGEPPPTDEDTTSEATDIPTETST
jgi:hypothetical protein